MLKVWIVGSEGQIGEAINEVLDPLEIEVLNTDKMRLILQKQTKFSILERSIVRM